MTVRGLFTLAVLSIALLLNACGGASGRQGSDFVVSGVGPSATLNGGDVATFMMTVRNAGDFTATDVVIENSVSQTSQSTLSITCTASGGATCPSPTGTTMTVSSFPANSSLTFQISGPTALGASGSVSDTMRVTVGSGDPDTSNNAFTVSASAVSNDVSVVATPPTGPLLSGPATFSMVVANSGPDSATNVSLVTTTSTNVTLAPADITCVANPGTGTGQGSLAAVPVLQPDGITLVSSIIPSGGGLTCTVPVVVAQATNGFAIVTMTATTLGDSRAGNNAGTGSVSATLVNDLGVTVAPPPTSGALVDSTAVFTAVITNFGPSTAAGVVITNTTSSGLTLSGAITCVPSGGATTPTLQADGTLLVAAIPLNATLTCSIPTTVAAGTNGLVADTVSVSTTDDPKPSNNSAQAAVQATLVNNISVTANAASAPSVPGGGSTTLTFSLVNNGPGTAYNAALSNLLSGAISFTNPGDPIQCSFAPGSTAVPPAKFVASGATATSTLPALAVGDVLNCSVGITVNAGANGTVSSTLSAVAPFDSLSINNSASASTVASSADIGVSQTGSTTVAAGGTANFVATVANPRVQGQTSPANNLTVTWSYTTPSTNVTVSPPTCLALGGAVCPATLVRDVPVSVTNGLLNGASLQFTFAATSASSSDRGVLTNTVSIASAGDPNPGNNAASVATTVVNANSGDYTVIAADGQSYKLTVDFDGLTTGSPTYTMVGAPATNVHSFQADASNAGDYIATDDNRLRFRLAQDMIVGSHNFAGGVLPYVAVRSFVGAVTQIAGSYDLVMRDLPVSGAVTTHAGTALISGNTLSICQSDTVEVTTVGTCAAGDLKTYSLSVSNNVFTGINSANPNEQLPFYVANVGAAKVLVSALTAIDSTSQAVTGRQFRLGVIDSQVGLATNPLRGPSSDPDWLQITLTNGSSVGFASTGTSITDSATLSAVGIGGRGPFSMLKGASSGHGGGQIYLMQSVPLTVVFGSSSVGGAAASGLLEIALP